MRDAVVASEVKPRAVKWLWEGRIPAGMCSIIAGKPDQGKGLVAMRIAADLTQRGQNVLISAIEDDESLMTRPRLEAAGANLDNVLLWRFVLPMMQRQLEAQIKANDIKLVVIDPMAAHLVGGVSRGSDSVRIVMNPLSELAEDTGCAFVIIEHQLKRVSPHAHALDAIGGSGSGIVAAARMAYLFGRDPKDRDTRLLCCVKSNLREKPKTLSFETDVTDLEVVGEVPYLITQEETDVPAEILLSRQRGRDVPGRPPDKRAAAIEWLSEYLFKAPKAGVMAEKIYEDARFDGRHSMKTVRNAAKDMGVVKKPPGGGRKCKWSLSPKFRRAMEEARKLDKAQAKKKGGSK